MFGRRERKEHWQDEHKDRKEDKHRDESPREPQEDQPKEQPKCEDKPKENVPGDVSTPLPPCPDDVPLTPPPAVYTTDEGSSVPWPLIALVGAVVAVIVYLKF